MNARILVALAVLLLAAAAVPFQGCGDNDASDETLPCCPVCGDGVCNGDENPCNCRAADCDEGTSCAAFIPECGNGICEARANPGESHENCPVDCPLACRECRRRPIP